MRTICCAKSSVAALALAAATSQTISVSQALAQLPTTVNIWPMANEYRAPFGAPPAQSQNLMMASLAGIVNRTTNGEVLLSPNSGTQPHPRYWLDQLKLSYPQITSQVQANPGWFIDQYKPKLSGFVLFDPASTESINVATSIAGVTNAIMVSNATQGLAPQSTRQLAESKGLTQIADARTMTYAQAYAQYGNQFNKDMLFHQAGGGFDHQLRDFAVMNKGFTFYSAPTSLATYANNQNPQARIFGWADSEFDLFQQASQSNQQVVASNHNWSSSATAKWKVPLLDQKQHTPGSVTTQPGKHYVAFVMSDGDNATWLTNGMGTDPKYFGNANRGKFDMTWDFTPSLADMNPVAHNFFYANANDGTAPGKPGTDTFVAAGGAGTAFPSDTPDIDGLAESIAQSMADADLRVTSILDDNYIISGKLGTIIDKPQVTGMMFKTYNDFYRGRNGAISWRNGKPIVSVKYSLWDGAESAHELIDLLNAAPTNSIDSEGSYTIVNVHPWSRQFADGTVPPEPQPGGNPMDNVWAVVQGLNANVEVVGLEELMVHLRNHFGTPVEGAVVSGTWVRDANSNWGTTRSNWTGAMPNFVNATVNFGAGFITGNRTITVTVSSTAGTINFDNPSFAYNIAGNASASAAITMDVTGGGGAPAAINVASGMHTIGAPLILGDDTTVTVTPAAGRLTVSNLQPTSKVLTKSGAGTLALTGPASTGGFDVQAGTLSSVNGFKGGGPLTIASGARAVVPVAPPSSFNRPLNQYPTGSNAAASRVSSLSITGSGQLDLGNSDMVINHAVGESPIDGVRAMLLSGYNDANWDGPGIVNSAALSTDPFVFAIGYADNALLDVPFDNFFGQDVDESSLLIKFTWIGDVTLDGLVDAQDLAVFSTKYDGGITTGRYWYEGDLNYDGVIDSQDLALFNTNYDPSKPSLPEPAGLGVVLIAGMGLLHRAGQIRTRQRLPT